MEQEQDIGNKSNKIVKQMFKSYRNICWKSLQWHNVR